MASSKSKSYQTMSASTATPQPPQSSALPPSQDTRDAPDHNTPDCTTSQQLSSDSSKVVPPRKPILRLQINDLSSDGSFAFLRLFHAYHALQDAVNAVLTHLYKDMPVACIPPVRSVTLIIREMDGVAYTTGLELDDDHKEIHFNTGHIMRVPESHRKEEIMGVIVHEMVHCWQHSGFGSAPVGLTEGVADWVRLKAGYAPPHWRRQTDCDWDAGYERTGYFLEWLEKEHGKDVVRRINEAMRGCEYDEEKVWMGCCGESVKALWGKYKKYCEEEREEELKKAEAEAKREAGPEADGTTNSRGGTEAVAQEEESRASQEDPGLAREKARRGGNMYVPVRPGV